MAFSSLQGRVEGYIKAGMHDLSVYDWQEDAINDGDNPLQWLFATTAPLEGTIDQVETPIWAAIVGIIKNAFVKTLDIKIDNCVQLINIQHHVLQPKKTLHRHQQRLS